MKKNNIFFSAVVISGAFGTATQHRYLVAGYFFCKDLILSNLSLLPTEQGTIKSTRLFRRETHFTYLICDEKHRYL